MPISERIYHNLPVFELNWRDRSRLKKAYDIIEFSTYLTSLPVVLESIDFTIPFFRTSNSTIRKVKKALGGKTLAHVARTISCSDHESRKELSLAWIRKLLEVNRGIVHHYDPLDIWDKYPVFPTNWYDRWVLRRVRKSLTSPKGANQCYFLCIRARKYPFTKTLIDNIRNSLVKYPSLDIYLHFYHGKNRVDSNRRHRVAWINKVLGDWPWFESKK